MPGDDRGEPKVGDNLAGYLLEEVVRRAPTGSVFHAKDPDGRKVVVKLLHGELAEDSVARGRLEREALAGVLASHPNCVPVLDIKGLPDGRMFLVLEHIDGQLLSDLLAKEGHLEPERALHIVRHVLSGLAHAHKAEIIHRNVAPANVVITEVDGDRDFARIMDFGVAKLEGSAGAGEEKLTRLGQTLGSPSYLAPEAVSTGHVDGRADLYSVASILYELLVGRPPFDSEDPIEVFRALAADPPPAFGQVAPELSLSPSIEALVRRGLEKSPDERFASAEEFIEAIDSCCTGEHDVAPPIDAEPQSPAAPGEREGSKRFDKTIALGSLDAMLAPAERPGVEPLSPLAGPEPGPPPAQPSAQPPVEPSAQPPAQPWRAWTQPETRSWLTRMRDNPNIGWILFGGFVFLVMVLAAIFMSE